MEYLVGQMVDNTEDFSKIENNIELSKIESNIENLYY